MKFFLDSANLEQIRAAMDMGFLDGVTTNPSLIAQEGAEASVRRRVSRPSGRAVPLLRRLEQSHPAGGARRSEAAAL